MSRLRASACGALLVAFGLAGANAAAHPLAPSLLDLVESEAGVFDVTWKASLLQPTGADVRPELPARCEPTTEPEAQREGSGVAFRWRVDCGDAGIVGETLRVQGLDRSRTDALVRVALRDGRQFQRVLTGRSADFTVPERARSLQLMHDYAALGVEHILTGWDHLLFVWGLLLLVASRRALLVTITSFTLGHSVTLALAALGYVDFPTGWIELAIAGSILFLAIELSGSRGAMGRGAAWLAGGFGLLHGLGFAGALAAVGLPAEAIPLSLLSFNVGIEVGQLLFVAAIAITATVATPAIRRAPGWAHAVPAYAIGSLAVFLCLERAQALVG